MANRLTAAPRTGSKRVYLPKFVISLLHTPRLPPTQAAFAVPLRLGKLDLRDYLWHAYGVRALRIRSTVLPSQVREDKPRAKIAARRRWFLPQSQKRMTITMDRPFVWPEEPKDYKPWDKDTWDVVKKEHDETRESLQKPPGVFAAHKDVGSIAEQAKRLLSADDKWAPQNEVTPILNSQRGAAGK